jgi:hypothetical protein
MPLTDFLPAMIFILLVIQLFLVYRAGGPKAYRDQLLGRKKQP